MVCSRTVTLSSLAAACIASASGAAVVPITSNTALSTEGLGAFTGTLNYTYLGGTSGQLDVTLTNTTDASIGGYIGQATSVAFWSHDQSNMIAPS